MPKQMKIKSPGTYSLHRERQRRRILDAAETIFDERGVDRTTMAEILSVTGLRASTLYAYFSKKDEIIWAIFGEMRDEIVEDVKQRLCRANTGLAKITVLLQYMAEQLSKDPDTVRFMAQFDALYARDWPVESPPASVSRHNGEGFGVLGAMVREGIADGSLRPDIDPELTLHAVVNAVLGAQRRLASLGAKAEAEYGQPVDRLLQEMIRIIILGLSAAEAPTHRTPLKPAPRPSVRRRLPRKRTP